MTSLKQSVKQILIKKQHKMYEKKLSEKKVCYADWIAGQEKQLRIDNIIVARRKKCLTNDSGKLSNGGEKNRNEGFRSKFPTEVQFFDVFDKNAGEKEKITFALVHLQENRVENRPEMTRICQNREADVILFLLSEGEISEIALPLIYKKLKEDKNIMLIYGDEDVCADQRREKPWFKPDWSPDTFLSYFYFGSLVAVRADALAKVFATIDKTDIYSVCYYILTDSPDKKDVSSVEDANTQLRMERKAVHIPEVLFHGKQEGYEQIKDMRLPEEFGAFGTYPYQKKDEDHSSDLPCVSVIIPSKDNPRVLFTCIDSVIEQTQGDIPYEIIVIDNGSSEENRRKITEKMEKLNREEVCGKGFRGMRYEYEPMTFNFSRMCNKGAALATGGYLLFLNDDMEVIQENWLSLLMDKAALPRVGAVGAKLLYPDSDIIQHAGITNLRVGPAHKLQFLSDDKVHYYGKNRFVHDVMAVTGACLLLEKEIFERAGGFDEKLAVAFNDVDLCYTIYEMGYYNVVRNDVVLYHHESLSRGKDGESEEKQLRLLREKDALYEKHQSLYGKDPFYHKYLTTDMLESEYAPAFHYQVTLDMPWAAVAKEQPLPEGVREDPCVVIGMECAMDIYKWKYGVAPDKGKVKPTDQDMGYYFQGYTFVIGADNACYKKTLLLENKENKRVLRIPLDERYRPDIKNNLKDQLNVDLTGFAAKVPLGSVPKGNYRFGMLVEDRCSRQKLVGYSNWVLQTQEQSMNVTEEKENDIDGGKGRQ